MTHETLLLALPELLPQHLVAEGRAHVTQVLLACALCDLDVNVGATLRMWEVMVTANPPTADLAILRALLEAAGEFAAAGDAEVRSLVSAMMVLDDLNATRGAPCAES